MQDRKQVTFPPSRNVLPMGLLIAIYAMPSCVLIGWALIHRSGRIAVAIFLTALIVAGVGAAITRYARPFFLAQFPFYSLGIGFTAYTVMYGMPPGQTLANLLVGASVEEVRGFAMLPQARIPILVATAVASAYLALALSIRSGSIFGHVSTAARRTYLTLTAVLLAMTFSDPSQLIDGIALQPIVGSIMFLSGDLPRAHAQLKGDNVRKIPYGATRNGSEEIHILVIGEAARRDSWSAYGYTRDTTPGLDALGDEVIWLRSATADANLTQWAVPIILTGIAPDKIFSARFTGNLFDLAKEANYRTAWLVNQDITISALVGVKADILEFPPDFNYSINGRHTLDEKLLPSLENIIGQSGSSRFVGIHMMGSHWEYYNRYPERFRRYGDADTLKNLSMISLFVSGNANEESVLDTYDNSVVYTDWFLRRVIDTANKSGLPVSVTYFPDHGEDLQKLDGSAGHGAPLFTQHAFSIPAFVWFSHAYCAVHSQEVAAVKANATSRIRSYNVFYALGDLMGIKWPAYEPRLSFASPQFLADQTTGVIAGGVMTTTPSDFPAP